MEQLTLTIYLSQVSIHMSQVESTFKKTEGPKYQAKCPMFTNFSTL